VGKKRVDPVELLSETLPGLRDEGADAQVVLDAETRKQPAVLGHVRDALLNHAVRWQAADRPPFQSHRAVSQRQQAGNYAHQRGLAGAVRPDHADRFALRHFERDAEQGLERAVAGRYGRERQHQDAAFFLPR
jgi:hypothetical protein